jgi:hypothetical protein
VLTVAKEKHQANPTAYIINASTFLDSVKSRKSGIIMDKFMDIRIL